MLDYLSFIFSPTTKVFFLLFFSCERWINQHDIIVKQRKNLSPQQEPNPWPPKHISLLGYIDFFSVIRDICKTFARTCKDHVIVVCGLHLLSQNLIATSYTDILFCSSSNPPQQTFTGRTHNSFSMKAKKTTQDSKIQLKHSLISSWTFNCI